MKSPTDLADTPRERELLRQAAATKAGEIASAADDAELLELMDAMVSAGNFTLAQTAPDGRRLYVITQVGRERVLGFIKSLM
jgi:hypothetical protein